MRKTIAVIIAGIAIGLCCGVRPAQAQDESKDASPAKTKSNPIQPYRLDFAFNELEDGKKVNTRHYSANLVAGQNNDIRIGTRVPVVSGHSADDSSKNVQFQYLDVGTHIWTESRERGDDIELTVHSDISNIDLAGPGTSIAPVVRQMKIEGSVLLVPGKPLLIGSVDDPNSKRQFELEVTVTKLR